jgi:hypothetical protein
MKEYTDPPYSFICTLLTVKLKALQKYLDEIMRMAKIWPRKSLVGALIDRIYTSYTQYPYLEDEIYYIVYSKDESILV